MTRPMIRGVFVQGKALAGLAMVAICAAVGEAQSTTGYLFGSSVSYGGIDQKSKTYTLLIGDSEDVVLDRPSPKASSGCVWITSGDSHVARVLSAPPGELGFGASVVGDLNFNDDDQRDSLVTSSGHASPLLLDANPGEASVLAYCGGQAAPLYRISAGHPNCGGDGYGLLIGPQVVTVGDCDHDKADDFAVVYAENRALPQVIPATIASQLIVKLVSGRSGKILWQRDDIWCSKSTALSLCRFDVDGTAELALGVVDPERGEPATKGQASPLNRSGLLFLACQTGVTVGSSSPPEGAGPLFGVCIQAMKSVVDSGLLAVGDPLAPRASVHLYSTKANKYVGKWEDKQNRTWGMALAGLGDLDGDGQGEVLVSAPIISGDKPSCWVVSGSTGRRMRAVFGNITSSDQESVIAAMGTIEADGEVKFGVVLRSVADLDGDGTGDYICVARSAECVSCIGTVGVYSGKTGRRIQLIYRNELRTP